MEQQRLDQSSCLVRCRYRQLRSNSFDCAEQPIHELKFPGELFSAGVLRDLGSHWIDQLLAFVDGNLVSSSLRRNFSKDVNAEDGFLAILEFTGGLPAMIEIQTDSLLSSRSGWYIERRKHRRSGNDRSRA